MQSEANLRFIREKIFQIRSALMYSMSNELVKMPNTIINVLDVDDMGQLWFLSKKPAQQVEQCEATFPARLVFYRKGISFFLEVSGKATIVNDPFNELLNEVPDNNLEKPVLMKMSMSNLEISEPSEKRPKGRLGRFIENSGKWLLHTLAVSHQNKPVLQRLRHAH